MANTKQTAKRARQNKIRRDHNASLRSRMRTYLKRTKAAIEAGDKTAASTAYKETVSILDRTVSKGIIHKNKAARHKRRLNAQIHALA